MEIYTDGGVMNNGQPEAYGAWAFVCDGHEASGRLERTTNNRAELTAIIRALEYAKALGLAYVEVFSDSQLCVFCGTGKWKRKSNLDLWAEYDAVARGLNYSLRWVRGHNGHPQNERADALCTLAMGGAPKKRFTESPTALAFKALRYWRDECSGAEPSLSVFNRMVDEALEAAA